MQLKGTMASMRRFGAWSVVWGVLAGCSDGGEPMFVVPPAPDASVAGRGGAGPAANPGGRGGNSGAGSVANPAGRGGAAGANAGTGVAGSSGECAGEAALSFAADIGPLLASRCTECHDDGGSGGLDLRSYAALLAGGAHGPAIVPGDCAASILWQKTGSMPPFGGRMPADGAPLSEAQRAEICAWIDVGAPESAPAQNCPEPEPCTGAMCPMEPMPVDDTVPPEFDGVDSIDEDGNSCLLSWEAASDDQSAAAAIVYEIFVRDEDGAFDAEPAAVTAAGATSHTLMLESGRDYEIRVVAVDEAGNRDANDRIRECSLR